MDIKAQNFIYIAAIKNKWIIVCFDTVEKFQKWYFYFNTNSSQK